MISQTEKLTAHIAIFAFLAVRTSCLALPVAPELSDRHLAGDGIVLPVDLGTAGLPVSSSSMASGTTLPVMASGATLPVMASGTTLPVMASGTTLSVNLGAGGRNDSVLRGILPALNPKVNLAPGLVVGEVIRGRDVSFVSPGPVVRDRTPPGGAPVSVPEQTSTFALGLIACGALFAFRSFLVCNLNRHPV
jgi:hypothetical protein